MATYKSVLNNRKREDGTFIVMVLITKYRKRAHVGTGIYIKGKDWNEKKAEVRTTESLYDTYNRALETIKQELRDIEMKARINGKDLSAEEIKHEYLNKNKEKLLSFCRNYIEKNPMNRAQSVLSGTESDLKRLEAFIDEDFLIKDFTNTKLKAYEKFLKESGLGQGTINVYNVRLSAIFSYAVAIGIIPHEKNPYALHKQKSHEGKKVILTIEEITTLYHAKLKPTQALYRDVYMVMFLGSGMRVGDAIKLQWSMIAGGRLRYKTKKNKKPKSIPLSDELVEIFDRYRGKGYKDYIFPLIKEGSEALQLKSHRTYMHTVLKNIAKKLKINPLINPHSAKHSFAEVAQEVGDDMRAIQGALDHSSVVTTERYMNEIGSHKSDKVVKAVAKAFRKSSSKVQAETIK